MCEWEVWVCAPKMFVYVLYVPTSMSCTGRSTFSQTTLNYGTMNVSEDVFVCVRVRERNCRPKKKMRIYTYSNNNITLYASSSLNWFPIHIRICVWIFQAHNFRRFSFSFLTLSYSPKIVTVCLRILDSVGLWVCVARNVCVRNGVCVCERPFSKPSIYCAFLLALSHFRIFQTLTQYFPSRFVRDVL